MLSFLAAIPVIGKAIDAITLLCTSVSRGIKWIVWKIQLKSLEKKKEEIHNAETPEDFTNIFNK